MSHEFLVSTTGVLSPVPIADLGNRSFLHPTVNLDIYLEFTPEEIADSADLKTALDLGYLTAQNEAGTPITDPGLQIDSGIAYFEFASSPGVTDDAYENGTIWGNTANGTQWILQDNTTSAAVWNQISGAQWTEDGFISTAGQITFILSTAPTDPASVEFDVNGVNYKSGGSDYTRSGVTITWLDISFIMDAGDRVLVRYR